MEINKMEYDFLVKSVLGQELNLNSKTEANSEEVIQKCIAKADRDMLTAGCNYLTSGKCVERRKALNDLLVKNDYIFSRKLIQDYSDVIRKMIREDASLQGKDVGYGLAQKTVNMVFKYFYVFNGYIDRNIIFKNCDCPIDSVILDSLGEKGIVWSQLDSNTYERIQEVIQKKIPKLIESRLNNNLEYCGIHSKIGNMLYDFIEW